MMSPGAHWGTSDAASNSPRWIDSFCARVDGLAHLSHPFGSLWRVRQSWPVPPRSRPSRAHLAWHCPCIRRLVDMAETEREVIEADFLRTKVKATQRSIDEPPGIDIGMFELDVDCWMGVGSMNCRRRDCCPLVACLEVLN